MLKFYDHRSCRTKAASFHVPWTRLRSCSSKIASESCEHEEELICHKRYKPCRTVTNQNTQVVPFYPSEDEDLKGARETLERPEIRLVTTRPMTAGESPEILENRPNAVRLCKYAFVDVESRSELCPFTSEVTCLV